MMQNTTLYTLFMPPENCYGDFGLICGFTATPQVLGQIRRTFAGEMARPVLAAFIHPTVNAVSDVPGLAWMWMRLKDRGYNLLHAKVALLGFRRRKDDGKDDGYVLRLAVSTGNWTQDPLTNSIDLFWSLDVNTATPNDQDIADIRAAHEMFGWLRERADCALIERYYDGTRPDARLEAAINALRVSQARPRFIDSRNEALFPQVVERFGQGKKGNRLILGSGYFEAAGNGTAGLPERLRQKLDRKNLLETDAVLDLFLNPSSCQGLADCAGKLTDAGWRLRSPVSERHGKDAKLHAKFVLLASGEDVAKGSLYLGSGNLSRNGFETAACHGGNLEAGIVIGLPEDLTWQGKGGITSRLPIHFKEIVAPTALQRGEDFARPEEPSALPPVSWLVWQDGKLSAPEDAAIPVIGRDGAHCTTPCDWPAPAPVIVWLADGVWRLPVIAEGVLVVLRPPDMTVEDVLAGLGSFPEAPERDQPEDGPDGGEPLVTGTDAPEARSQVYPIRRMMSLLVRLAEAQAKVDRHDWGRWCRELRQNLCAISVQEEAMIDFFRCAHANPLLVLAEPRTCPEGADDADRGLLNEVLDAVAKEWKLDGCTSLWNTEKS